MNNIKRDASGGIKLDLFPVVTIVSIIGGTIVLSLMFIMLSISTSAKHSNNAYWHYQHHFSLENEKCDESCKFTKAEEENE